MKIFLTMVKINIANTFRGGSGEDRKKKIVKYLLFGLLFVYLAGYLSFILYSLAEQTSIADGNFALVLLYGGLMCSMFSLIVTFSGAGTTLFKAKDNDLLLSMPIKKYKIILAKLFALLTYSYACQTVCLIPAITIFFVYAGVSVLSVFISLICFLLFPLVTFCIAVFLSAFFSFLTSRSKNKNLLSVIGMFLMMIALVYIMYTFDITAISQQGGGSFPGVSKFLPNLIWFTEAISMTDILPLLWLFLASTVLILLLVWFLNAIYFKLVSRLGINNSGTKKVEYKTHSQVFSFFKKEAKKYSTTPIWLFNSGFGLFILPVASIYLSVVKYDLTPYYSIFNLPSMAILLSFALCMLIGTCNTTCVSISLEGSQVELLNTLPVKKEKIMLAKILFNLALTFPFIIFSAVLLGITYSVSIWYILIMIFLPALFVFTFSIFGLWVNFKLPKTDAMNETIVVKQSLSTLIGISLPMLLPIIVISIYIGGLMTVISTQILLLIFSLLLIATSVIFGSLLYKNREKYFKKLTNK